MAVLGHESSAISRYEPPCADGRLRRPAAASSRKRVPCPTSLSHDERAAVLLDDAVGHRQAEAGAAALGLRREERIVDAREVLGRNADAGVGHLDDAPRRRRRAVDTESQPPFGIASRAFRNRFRNTCWSLYSTPRTTTGGVGQIACAPESGSS